MLSLLGCGGSSGSSNDGSSPPEQDITIVIPVETKEGAANFLSHATFGSKKEDIDALYTMGGYIVWLKDQFNKPTTRYIDWIDRHLGHNMNSENTIEAFYNAYYSISVTANDQLRQRVALALSEIIVISIIGAEKAYTVADYYDLLLENAFGNYRDILRKTALHPSMGIYLSTWGNMKEHNTTNGTVVHADENFAREILQLFTIGLVQLELNGEPKRIVGHTIPTYTQKDIEEFAKVYTGWTTDNGHFYFLEGTNTLASLTRSMVAFEEYHDISKKEFSEAFSNVYDQQQIIPSGLSASTDLDSALDIIFNHPNIGPFISKQLIQRLVTSNPAPEYVARVASVFNDNGQGIKGDMKAVITAILTDKEALLKHQNERSSLLHTQGKQREQLIRLASVMRTFRAKGDPQITNYTFYNFTGLGGLQGLHLRPLTAPSVFNYYFPDFKPSGILQENNLTAPEFQILTPLKMSSFGSVMLSIIGLTDYFEDKISLDLTYEKSLLASEGGEALIGHLNLLLMSGQMSNTLKEDLIEYTDRKKTAHDIIEQLIALIVLSAEYAIER
jgi:uncharacterized protein (DUF1800 family)